MTMQEFWRLKQARYMSIPRVRARVNAQRCERYRANRDCILDANRERYATNAEYRARKMATNERSRRAKLCGAVES